MEKQRKVWSTDVMEAILLSVLRGKFAIADAARQRTAPVWGMPASPETATIKRSRR